MDRRGHKNGVFLPVEFQDVTANRAAGLVLAYDCLVQSGKLAIAEFHAGKNDANRGSCARADFGGCWGLANWCLAGFGGCLRRSTGADLLEI